MHGEEERGKKNRGKGGQVERKQRGEAGENKKNGEGVLCRERTVETEGTKQGRVYAIMKIEESTKNGSSEETKKK